MRRSIIEIWTAVGVMVFLIFACIVYLIAALANGWTHEIPVHPAGGVFALISAYGFGVGHGSRWQKDIDEVEV